MSGWRWPSWCAWHHRPHVRSRQLCMTNRDRRVIRQMLAERADRMTAEPDQRPGI